MKFSGGKMLAAGAVVGGALLASVAPVMADVAAQSPSVGSVRIESPAKIKAAGAAAEVKVTVACQAGTTAYLNVNLTQNTGIGVARGYGYAPQIQCNGWAQTYTVTVTAQDKAFIWADAFAQASLHGWPNDAKDERKIRLSPFA